MNSYDETAGAIDAEIRLPAPVLLKLLEVRCAAKLRPRATEVLLLKRLELESAQAAQVLIAYTEDAVLCLSGHHGGREEYLIYAGRQRIPRSHGQ
eukprot:jgi/Tetstr1/438629/TSEL_027180.t1